MISHPTPPPLSKSDEPPFATFVIDGGTVVALAGGPLSIADLGQRATKRASHVEFSNPINEWVVTDAATGEVLFFHPDYDTAITWETHEFNRRLAAT